jgi:hypothetical protein
MKDFYILNELWQLDNAAIIKNEGALKTWIHTLSYDFIEDGLLPLETATLIMKWKAKKTDLIRGFYINKGMLISKRFYDLLQTFNLPEHKAYKLNVVYRGVSYPDAYFWVQFVRLPISVSEIQTVPFDLFHFKNCPHCFVVSSLLHDAIKSENISGVTLEKFD